MRFLTFFALALSLPVTARATILEQARFLRLNPEIDCVESELVSYGTKGFQVVGEKISLQNGKLDAEIQKVVIDGDEAQQIKGGGQIQLDDAFFQNPVKAITEDLLTASWVTIERFTVHAQILGEDPESVTLKTIKLNLNDKKFTFEAKALLIKMTGMGLMSYNPQTQKISAEIQSITMAGLPVPMDLAFYVLSKFIHYPFITLEKPRIVIDMGFFLRPSPPPPAAVD